MQTNEQGLIITHDPKLLLRLATPEDAALVCEYGRRLAAYLHMEHAYLTTEEKARRLLEEKKGEAAFGYYDGELIAFTYFTEKSSIFIGENGIFIDMLFIDDSMRGKGIGKTFLSFLAQLARERGCRRIEWSCLDTNEPAINFYMNLGAYRADGQHIYRFTPELIDQMAELF